MTKVDNVIQNSWIERDLKKYEGFYDHEWAKRACQNTLTNQRLLAAITELCLAWKGASNAFRYPWMLANFHEKFVDGYLDDYGPVAQQVVQVLRKRIVEHASTTGRLEGLEAALEICNDINLSMQNNRKQLLASNKDINAWEEYLKYQEFQLSIVALMNQTFTSLFFAYEHFVLVCYQIISNDPETRTSQRKFGEKLKAILGPTIAEQCWTGDRIRRHSKVRNAIAHNGGKYNADLGEWRSELHIIDDVIQIGATDVRKLHYELKANSDILISTVIPQNIVST